MVTVAGCRILAQIYESSNSLVYRGIRESDQQSVILKVLKQDYPTPAEINRYQQEYQITRSLNFGGVVQAYSLEPYQTTLVIIFEDFGGSSLKLLLQKRGFTLKEFLSIAIRNTESLGRIHAAHIIHKDINPANIVFNPETEQLKIIDFGIATVLSRENPTLKNPSVLEGTLAYMSPEQTGRMNRALDYRTDFYSLGVTFYELLTHHLPFETEDPLELVHSHLAKEPIPPHQINPQIPPALSAIVMKLLAKNAEDRYQSAWGLKSDLTICLMQLETKGKIELFSLGRQDISERFQIPQKLYGREREIKTLLDTFIRVTGRSLFGDPTPNSIRVGVEQKLLSTATQNPLNPPLHTQHLPKEMIVVSGYSGIGKSALVKELYKPITQRRGYFIRGKFDQYQRDSPYSAVIKAFQELIKHLLTETTVQLSRWRNQLLAALGVNAKIIIDVIPEVELIIGKPVPVPSLPPTESQNRFKLVLQNFIRVFAKPEHPLVIFLDDLQWADRASLKLMEWLMNSSNPGEADSHIGGLFMIGAYRDNEVSESHPLLLTFNTIRSSGTIIHQIVLAPLGLMSIIQLVTETLKCSPDHAQHLAELVQLKTGGNPFFVNEFLNYLYKEKIVIFDSQGGTWQWDIAKIQAQNFTDNVVAILVNKIQTLSPKVQRVLQFAACLGNSFELKPLALALGESQSETAVQLWQTVVEGLIVPLGESYKLIRPSNTTEVLLHKPQLLASNPASLSNNIERQNFTIQYKFAHNRIQHTAYSLIPQDQCQAIHYRVGQLLLQNTPKDQLSEALFNIVNHLNISIELIQSPEEQNELAQLNLWAGQKAKAATAYEAAMKYLTIGRELLPPDSWQVQYELTLNLSMEAIEVAYLLTDFATAQTLTNVVLNQAETLIHKVKVYEIQILFDSSQNQMLSAIKTAKQVLNLLEIPLTKTPPVYQTVEALADLPEMTQPTQLAALRILMSVMAPAYIAKPSWLPSLIFTMVNLCIRYGNSSLAAYAYSVYSLLLCGKQETIDQGYRFGQLALTLLERFNAKDVQAKVQQQFNAFVRPWKEPARKTLNPLLDTIQRAIEQGDIEYACHCTVNYCTYSFFVGLPLAEVESKQAQHLELNHQFKQDYQINYITIWRNLSVCLIEANQYPHLDLTVFDQVLPDLLQANNQLSILSVYWAKLFIYYLFGNDEAAETQVFLAEKYKGSVKGLLNSVLANFYSSLVLLALCHSASPSKRRRYLSKVARQQKTMRHWAEHAPCNFQHKYDLVEAERAGVGGKIIRAMEYYDRAIRSATKQGYLHEEALAYERASQFYQRLGREEIAQNYLQKAHYVYSRWGAMAKVKQLESRYSQWLFTKVNSNDSAGVSPKSSIVTTTTQSRNKSPDFLDLNTVMKAAQVISGEIVLDKLLTALMKILIENAGAQKGFLILETKGRLRIEAEGQVNTLGQPDAECNQIQVLQSTDIEQTHILSVTIINYVARTQELVVLNDALNEGQFTQDSYIQQEQPKSILCAPLINQGKLSGIVYLENNLTTGAFTANRLELLRLLSAQAATSIENARFYSSLAELNQAYERFVPRQFLQFLNKDSIVDVQFGDNVQQKMSILFSDIRSFTTLSETMTPEDNFKFINAYLSRMEPAITDHNGFIDKYIGDAIMALFSGQADDAVKAGIAMLHQLRIYNQHRQNSGYPPIRIGIGINTGGLMLGTIGGVSRMDSTVISDAVNLASRIEGLTKYYQVPLLISHHTFSRLSDPTNYAIRLIDKVKVKGKSELVTVYEVFDADLPEIKAAKLATLQTFTEAWYFYNLKAFAEAKKRFAEVMRVNPQDQVANIYLNRCQ
ncbi:MAG: AAA family ATPase [Coleofasciculus sp. C1-SOL-03]|uniref:AAA family ATPase n=1 Tax=Coleofasciculus sp. C1-SOL-03 TaxID=3069522 RepID=UPI003302BFF8